MIIEFKPSLMVLVEGTYGRGHSLRMLTCEDHRQIAERCIRLAKTCTEPRVAEKLLIFATNHLEQAELALMAAATGKSRHRRSRVLVRANGHPPSASARS